MQKLVLKDNNELLNFKDQVKVLNVNPLSIDFTISKSTINDEEEVVFTALGSSADSYVWTDVAANKVIGTGSPLTVKYNAGVGLRSIRLIAGNSISSLFGQVTKEACLSVTIKEVDEFISRVDAEIVSSGGAYQQSWVDHLNYTWFRVKHSEIPSLRSMARNKRCVWYCGFPASPKVMTMEFLNVRSVNGKSLDAQAFNDPLMGGENNAYLVLNGIDQFVVPGDPLHDVLREGDPFILHTTGVNTGFDGGFYGALSNNNSRHVYCYIDADGGYMRFVGSNVYNNNIGEPFYGVSGGFLQRDTTNGTNNIAFYSNGGTNPQKIISGDPGSGILYTGNLVLAGGTMAYGGTVDAPSLINYQYHEWGGHMYGNLEGGGNDAAQELIGIMNDWNEAVGRSNPFES